MRSHQLSDMMIAMDVLNTRPRLPANPALVTTLVDYGRAFRLLLNQLKGAKCAPSKDKSSPVSPAHLHHLWLAGGHRYLDFRTGVRSN